MTQKDRKTQNRERQNPTHPLPPANLEVLFAFDQGLNAFDLRWDDPTSLGGNKNWDILGVNVYRSNNSELGPYYRLNDEPLGAPFYRDATLHKEVIDENVSSSFLAKGQEDEGGKWIFQVDNYPIVKPDSENYPANHPSQVIVKIDGNEVPVEAINGATGEVQLRADPIYDTATNKLVSPVLPNPESTVTCTYHYNLNLVTNMLDRKVFYRVTTVGYRHWDGVDENGDPIEEELLETPLAWTEAKTIQHMENMDYIWREGIRRNAWILDQGGERVWAFIRKWTGELCDCWDHDYLHPDSSCLECFATGYVGGYEGPYELKIAPQDADKNVVFDQTGFHLEHIYEVWTGPTPMLSQRDFIVKKNNDRYSIGPVRMPTNRGNILQQHFSIDMIDSLEDIRQEVPLNLGDFDYPETRAPTLDRSQVHKDGEPIPNKTNDQITDHEDVPNEVEERGRTPTYDNITKTS